jgi:hypothetical protein
MKKEFNTHTEKNLEKNQIEILEKLSKSNFWLSWKSLQWLGQIEDTISGLEDKVDIWEHSDEDKEK